MYIVTFAPVVGPVAAILWAVVFGLLALVVAVIVMAPDW